MVSVAPITTDMVSVAPITVDMVSVAPITVDMVSVAPITTDMVSVAPITVDMVSVAPITVDMVSVAPITTDMVSVTSITTDVVRVTPGKGMRSLVARVVERMKGLPFGGRNRAQVALCEGLCGEVRYPVHTRKSERGLPIIALEKGRRIGVSVSSALIRDGSVSLCKRT